MIERLRWWAYGWYCFARAIRLARAKRHGAGPMKWRYAFAMGKAYRWLVYEQRFLVAKP